MPLDLSIKRLHALSDIVVVKVTPIVQSSTFFLRHEGDLKILALLALWQFLYTVTVYLWRKRNFTENSTKMIVSRFPSCSLFPNHQFANRSFRSHPFLNSGTEEACNVTI